METLLELVFQVFGEVILQLVLEALAELGLHRARAALHRPPAHPWTAALGSLLLGAAAGGLSLLLLPTLLIRANWARWLNLALAPLAAGLAMSMLGKLRRRQGKELIRLDSFSHGFLFALPMGLVRFLWGH